jgi:hypothetical protein
MLLIAAGLGGLAAVSSTAAPSNNDKALSVASDLGVGLDELVACRNEARGQAGGERGTAEHRAAVQAIVLSCLQRTRPDMTADQFNAVMAKHRTAQQQP